MLQLYTVSKWLDTESKRFNPQVQIENHNDRSLCVTRSRSFKVKGKISKKLNYNKIKFIMNNNKVHACNVTLANF